MAAEDGLYGDAPDKYGYTRYSVVLHAPAELAGAIQRFRDRIGMGDLKTEAHVSISDTLYGLEDMAALKKALEALAASLPPLTVAFAEAPYVTRPQGGFFEVAPTAALLQLRRRVVETLDGLIQARTRPQYWPHMTLFQEATPQEIACAAGGPGFGPGQGFEAKTLDLVGRTGSPRQGTRQILERFAFGKG